VCSDIFGHDGPQVVDDLIWYDNPLPYHIAVILKKKGEIGTLMRNVSFIPNRQICAFFVALQNSLWEFESLEMRLLKFMALKLWYLQVWCSIN